MKRLSKILCLCLTIFCMFSSGLILSACSKKYDYETFKNVAYGEHERQTLNLFLPKEKNGNVGLILFIHGGGWAGGDKSCYDDELDHWCKTYGYATASINYRYISNEIHSEDILEDISSSLQKIKDMAKEKGINIEKVLLSGSSAGAHLSLLYAYKYANTSSIKPVAVASFCAPTDLTDTNYFNDEETTPIYLDLFSKLCDETITRENLNESEIQEKMLDSSPINFIDKNFVPTLICHGLKDIVVPYSNATTLKNRLDFYGVKNDLVTYPSSGHELGKDKKQSKQAKKLMQQYAKTYLK